MCVITPWHSSNPMPIRHLLVMESMVIHRQGTLAMTGRAHCQRQVAFFSFLHPHDQIRSPLYTTNLFVLQGTANELSDGESYQHIMVAKPLGLTSWDLLSYIQNDVQPSNSNADCILELGPSRKGGFFKFVHISWSCSCCSCSCSC